MPSSLSPFVYQRRKTREVVVGDPVRGGVIIGGNHPVVMQSMITCDTMDTAECVQQTLDLVAVGCQMVRSLLVSSAPRSSATASLICLLYTSDAADE